MAVFQKSSFFAISHLEDDELSVTLLEGTQDTVHVLESKTITTGAHTDPKANKAVRSHFSRHALRNPTWIHLVLRDVAFAKVLSPSEGDRRQLTGKMLEDQIQAAIPCPPHKVLLHPVFQRHGAGDPSPVAVFGVFQSGDACHQAGGAGWRTAIGFGVPAASLPNRLAR